MGDIRCLSEVGEGSTIQNGGCMYVQPKMGGADTYTTEGHKKGYPPQGIFAPSLRDRLLIPQVLIFCGPRKRGEGVWTSENLILKEKPEKIERGRGSKNEENN